MKRKDPSVPVTLRPGRSAALALTLVGLMLCAALLLIGLFVKEAHPLFCLVIPVGFAPAVLISLLADLKQPRVTVGGEGVTLHHTRKGWQLHLPWSGFTHMYTLTGYKTCDYLFTPAPMDKAAQYAARMACLRNRERPGAADGCLLMTDGYSACSREITSRIPEHIRIAPEHECCSLWDRRRFEASSGRYRTGDDVRLYRTAAFIGILGVVCCFWMWQPAVLLLALALFLAAIAYFRTVALTVDAHGARFTNARRKLDAFFPWERYACLYQLIGVTRALYVLSPGPLTKAQLKDLVRQHEQSRGMVAEHDGCLILPAGRSGDEALLAHIPSSVRRMPFSDGISL